MNPPTDVSLSLNQLAENLAVGSTVGSLQAIDPDVGDPITFALVAGTGDSDNAAFTLVGNVLRTAVVFDHETKTSYSIRVRATDRSGLFLERVLSVTVVDLPEMIGEAAIGDGTAQRSLVSQVKLTFDGLIDIAVGAFSVIQRGTNNPVILNTPAVVVNAGQTVVTLSFQGSLTRGPNSGLVDGFYQLTVDGTKITRAGMGLDANRDGTGGDSYVFGDQEADKFFAYYGDTDGDGQVGVAEFGQFRTAFGSSRVRPATTPSLITMVRGRHLGFRPVPFALRQTRVVAVMPLASNWQHF